MVLNRIDDATLRHYLLGELSDEDLAAFEKRLLTDDEVFEELLAAEDDLIDEYVANRLSNNERDTFEKHFLITSERQEDVEFATTLRKFIQKKQIQNSHWWNFSRNQAWLPRIAAILVVSFVAYLAYLYFPRAPKNIAEITLTPSIITRGENNEAQATVNLRDKDALRINLKLPEDSTPATKYRAELIGDTKATVDTIKYDSESVTVEIAASDLTSGEYALRLHAIGSDGSEQRIRSYSFVVQKN